MIHTRVTLADPAALIGLVFVRGLQIGPSPAALNEELTALVAQRAGLEFPPPPIKEGLRNLLRANGFKPSGRNKPASEYLAQAARDDRFPFINNAVDCNNLVSLETGLPVSVLDARAFGSGHDVTVLIRPGKAGESYVFNQAGQEIDLAGLPCACNADVETGSRALGNAVKDSMTGKLKDDSADVVGVIWATTQAISPAGLEAATARFAELLVRHCGGRAEWIVATPH